MIEGTYSDRRLKEISQHFFDELGRNKEGFFQLRGLLRRAVELYLENPCDERLKMVISLFETHKDHDIMTIFSDIWRLKRLVMIIRTESEMGLSLFSGKCRNCDQLLEHLNRCIFSLRRLEMAEEGESDFLQEGIYYLTQNRVSPVAVNFIFEEEVLVQKQKIYSRLCRAYEKGGMPIYAQLMQAIT